MAIGNIHSGIIAGKLNGADADRLAQGVGIDTASDVLGKLAHLQAANGAGVLHHFQAAENIAFSVGNGFALLVAEYHGNTLGVFANQRLKLEHDAHPRADRRQPPGLEGAMGGADGGIDFGGCGEGDFGQHLLGRRVDDVVPFGGLGFDPLAIDQQLDLLHGGF